MGLTPVIDGEIIRISIPSLSEERRLEYLKLAKTKLEAGRVMIRQIRGDAMRDIKNRKRQAMYPKTNRNTAKNWCRNLPTK